MHLQVAEICKQKGSKKVDVMPVDLSDMSQVDKFAEDVLKKYGAVDVLVNNAAILGPISYEGDATKNPNMGQGPIDGKLGAATCIRSAHMQLHFILHAVTCIITIILPHFNGKLLLDTNVRGFFHALERLTQLGEDPFTTQQAASQPYFTPSISYNTHYRKIHLGKAGPLKH